MGLAGDFLTMQRHTACLATVLSSTLTTGVRPRAHADPSLQPASTYPPFPENNDPARVLVSADILMKDAAGGSGLTAFSLR